MVVEQSAVPEGQHAQPQHIQSATSDNTDVQDWRSVAIAPDSTTQVTAACVQ